MKNAIVRDNTSPMNAPLAAGRDVTFSCLDRSYAGAGNIAADPLFADPSAGDYRLRPGSPCLDTGTNLSWAATGTDLDGNARIDGVSGTNDMGCFELQHGELTCSFAADAPQGLAPHTVTLQAHVAGTNTAGLYYRWDFGADGSIEAEGAGFDSLTSNLNAGVWSVRLTASNSIGQTDICTRADYLKAGPVTAYVARAGFNSNAFPYDSWATAASNIHDAVAAGVDGTTVLVTNGQYDITEQIEINHAMTLRSVNGHAATVIDKNRSTGRCLYVGHTNGLVDGFTVRGGWAVVGAGAYLLHGSMHNCLVISNDYNGEAGGVLMVYEAALRNCAVLDNRGGNYPGGVRAEKACTFENVTIAGNRAYRSNAGFSGLDLRNGSHKLYNVIVYGNTGVNLPTMPQYGGGVSSSEAYNSCLVDPVWSGGGGDNISEDPRFVDLANDNVRLQEGFSPCIGTGTNLDWALEAGALDLDGNPRISPDGRIDMGPYEVLNPNALTAGILVDPQSGFAPLSVTLTGTAEGGNTNGLYYKWDFEDDGVIDEQGFDKRVVVRGYAAGTWSVALIVTNNSGEVAGVTNAAFIKAGPRTNYVSLAGAHNAPFASWSDAATNIQAAVEAGVAGTLVLVTNGVYVNYQSQISIDDALTVRSMNGHGASVIQGGVLPLNNNHRCVELSHTNATIDGFTLRYGGYGDGNDGGGVSIEAGGKVHNCLITECSVNGSGGGAYNAFGGEFRNCLIVDNYAASRAGGIYAIGALTLENVTISANTSGYPSASAAAGVKLGSGSTVINTIVFANTNERPEAAGMPDWAGDGTAYNSCLNNPAWSGPGADNFAANPQFADAFNGDYRLLLSSPCVDAGTNAPWAFAAGAKDLDGERRRSGIRVDIGAYEFQYPSGTLILVR